MHAHHRAHHRRMAAADEIRADIDALREPRGGARSRQSRPPVSASRIRRRTGFFLTAALVMIATLLIFGVIRLAISVGGALLDFAWPSARLGQVLTDILSF